MRALLDTNALIWSVIRPSELSRAAREIIVDESNVLYVSAASAWEVSTKVRLGKLPQAEDFERDFDQVIPAAGFTFLPIDIDVALRAGRLIGARGDPFDRMIAAQALALDIPVLSPDAKLDTFGARRIW